MWTIERCKTGASYEYSHLAFFSRIKPQIFLFEHSHCLSELVLTKRTFAEQINKNSTASGKSEIDRFNWPTRPFAGMHRCSECRLLMKRLWFNMGCVGCWLAGKCRTLIVLFGNLEQFWINFNKVRWKIHDRLSSHRVLIESSCCYRLVGSLSKAVNREEALVFYPFSLAFLPK